jgi:hypothetical protein
MPDKHYTVLVQERALDMLAEHVRFLARVSETAANRLVDEFEEQAGCLASNPMRCPWLADPLIPSYKYRKLLFARRYLIVFQVIEDVVSIDAVVDCRQNYGWLI